MTSLPYKKVLVIGATSGIGQALSERFLQTGTSVIAVGRRKENLDKFTQEHGNKSGVSVDTAVFDITNIKAIPQFATDMFAKHPDIDCVFLNSGVQRSLDWTKPEEVDLEKHEWEFVTNYTSYLHLTKAFLPLLQKSAPKERGLVFTTSGLALVPIMPCPNYCASKAALHHMILVLREQLRNAGSNVRVIEVLPPAVQTELHDAEHGEKGKDIGIPLKDFTDEAFAGLCKPGKEGEHVPVAGARNFMGYDSWEQERQKTMLKMMESMK